jgi:hypothetical protein
MRASRIFSMLASAVGAILLVSGCATGSISTGTAAVAASGAVASQSASSTAQASNASATVFGSTTPSPETDPDTVSLAAGQHRALVWGAGSYPTITVVVPAGWYELKDRFVVKYPDAVSPGPVLGLSVWDVGRIPGDPCKWRSTLRDPGPGVDALVAALVAQTGRHATAPVKATLAGQSGQSLTWSVPAWQVTGDGDFAGCDDPGNGHHDFVSWFGSGGSGERWEQEAGQVDRLWVLDVKGQRLVVDATYSPSTVEADRAELAGVVASLRFVAP